MKELADLQILDIASGYSIFNSEATAIGAHVRSVDPLFEPPKLSEDSPQISRQELVDGIRRIALKELSDFEAAQGGGDSYKDAAWMSENPLSTIDTPAKILAVRRQVLDLFSEDFLNRPEHYIADTLPAIERAPSKNDLILIGNFLGAYSAQDWCSYDFHLRSILRASELLSDGGEIRLYPAAPGPDNKIGIPFDVPLTTSSHKDEAERGIRITRCLKEDLAAHGLSLELVPSEHQFVKGWTHTAIIKRI